MMRWADMHVKCLWCGFGVTSRFGHWHHIRPGYYDHDAEPDPTTRD